MNGVSGNPYQGWVIKLIILNVVVFVAQIITIPQQIVYTISGMDQQIAIPAMTYYLGLLPAAVVSKGYVWQAVTYMFLHSTTGFAHIFFNMYALLIFGIPIEQAWGGKFLTYYMFCGIGAGLSTCHQPGSGGAGFWSPPSARRALCSACCSHLACYIRTLKYSSFSCCRLNRNTLWCCMVRSNYILNCLAARAVSLMSAILAVYFWSCIFLYF